VQSRIYSVVRSTLTLCFVAAFFVSCTHKEVAQPSGQATVDYAPRIGIAVATGSRTCLAIQNPAVQPGSPVTLVSPVSPQSFSTGTVSGPSPHPCPITQDVNPLWTSYEITAPNGSGQKLMPLIAVIGNSSGFLTENLNVQADLDQNGKTELFRACGASDGVHLSVWRSAPLTGTLVWKGYYYESGNPGTLPTCTSAETATP
jgi:hypothetical protein